MFQQTRRDAMAVSSPDQHSPADGSDLQWPFGHLDSITDDDIRETAYEIFFMACRSSPGFGGRNGSISHHSGDGGGDGYGSPTKKGAGNGVGMAVTSRVKKALGLKMLRRSLSTNTRRMSTIGGGGGALSGQSSPQGSSPGTGIAFTVPQSPRLRRPMTSAEIMRQQMRVTEQSDNRLRKTIMRTLVGQTGRRAETIILPLELLRHLKPSEFSEASEYHSWQKRQLKLLEAALLLYPSIPLHASNSSAARLKLIIKASDAKPLDTNKNSEHMKALCAAVFSLAWRTHRDESSGNACHWADGYPLNVHIYISLLRAIFDLRDESLVLDEVDELLELIKKTWSTLGINKPIHNLCFAWVLFQQFVVTGQVEGDLLCATSALINEVGNDAKKGDRDPLYLKMLSSALTSIKRWSEKRLLYYRSTFHRGNVGLMEKLLPLSFTAAKILEEAVVGGVAAELAPELETLDSTGNRVDHYIRSSMNDAFSKLQESGKFSATTSERQEVIEALVHIARETEELALEEKVVFSPVLTKWHPFAAGVAAVTLHTCYGALLRQFLAGMSSLTNETIRVLKRAEKLEKVLVHLVTEDTEEWEDGGRTIAREIIPYEVDSIKSNLLQQWIQRAKEIETWNPISKTEPYAQSSVDLMSHAKETVNTFFEIPLDIPENLLHEFADGLEHIIRDYITFVASCGTKQSYVPTLPPLTRCYQEAKFFKLWKKASTCSASAYQDMHLHVGNEPLSPCASTSRGTQRLYIRLNTLHYLLTQINALDKSLSLSPRVIASSQFRCQHLRRIGNSFSYFDLARSAIQSATQYVSQVAAYRLIFLDSTSVFYDTLYWGDVQNARIQPAVRSLKQNLILLGAMVTDQAQSLVAKEVMIAAFEAFLMVLLAGGKSRIFLKADHKMIEEDFLSLKRVFCTCEEGMISEDAVEKEAKTVEGVLALMGQPTEQLLEDFSIAACEASGTGVVNSGQKLPMPPTTGKWNRSDPNTILRVLCHRNDRVANQFLKRTFQLARR
ncbi:hypothetical protein NMG60_11031936 [Bertholletia excelsa]